MFPDGLLRPPSPSKGAATVQYPHEKETPATRARGVISLARGQLHLVHAVRPRVPRLVHLHRGPQDPRPAAPGRRQAPSGQRPRPLRHRLLALHVLRHLRRGVPVRGPLLEPGVRVLRGSRSPTCSTTRTGSGSGSTPCPTSRPTRPAPRSRSRRCPDDRRRAATVVGRHDPTFDVPANIAFGVVAVVMIFAAIRVVTTKNVVHAALYLVVVLAGVGINYLLLQAEFVAITQFLVYIGAIVVLFLFGIMLTRAPLGISDDLDNNQRVLGVRRRPRPARRPRLEPAHRLRPRATTSSPLRGSTPAATTPGPRCWPTRSSAST